MFEQICRLKDGYIAKEMFNHRVVRYVNGDPQTVGFVPDIYRLLQKYGMIELFDTYLQCGAFPSKFSWKQKLKSTVIMPSQLNVLTELICAYPWLDGYIIDSSQCSNLLRVGRIQPHMKYTCQAILKVVGKLVSNQYVSHCKLCDKITFNSVEHVICFCTNNDAHRNRVWDAV